MRIDRGLLRGLHLQERRVPLFDLRHHRAVVREHVAVLRGVPLCERYVPPLRGPWCEVLGKLDVLFGKLRRRHLSLIEARTLEDFTPKGT